MFVIFGDAPKMVIFKEKRIFRARQESVLRSSPLASDIQDHL